MRTDEKIAAELDSTGMFEQRWKGDATSGWMEEPGGEISLSISGYERNRLFLGAGGSQFRDLSGVSGLDALADGRAFALTDYDRDGWQDVAAVNTNAPLLQLFHNDIAARGAPETWSPSVSPGEITHRSPPGSSVPATGTAPW